MYVYLCLIPILSLEIICPSNAEMTLGSTHQFTCSLENVNMSDVIVRKDGAVQELVFADNRIEITSHHLNLTYATDELFWTFSEVLCETQGTFEIGTGNEAFVLFSIWVTSKCRKS